MPDPIKSEPARIASLISAAVLALLGLGAAFGLQLDDAQRNAILACIPPVVAAVLALGQFIRGQVTPTDKAETAVKASRQEAFDRGYDYARRELTRVPTAVRDTTSHMKDGA